MLFGNIHESTTFADTFADMAASWHRGSRDSKAEAEVNDATAAMVRVVVVRTFKFTQLT